jgi:hypothetical protein
MPGLTSKGFLVTIAFVALMTACSENPGRNPVAPSVLGGDASSAAVEPGAVAASHGLTFTAVVGQGSGTLNVTASSRKGAFTLNAQVSVNVHGVSPNTVLYLVRSGDIALSGQQADGVCQRAAAGLFFPVLVNGSPVILETSPGGAGAVHFELQGNDPFLPDGAGVDVVYRLVDALPPAAPTIDLRTPCFTFTAK